MRFVKLSFLFLVLVFMLVGFKRQTNEQYAESLSSQAMYVCWDRGAGDIISNAADLNVFHKALRSGKLISSKMFNEMRKFSSMGIENNSYGLGCQNVYSPVINSNLQGHAGGYPGSTTQVYYWIEKDTYIALNNNGNGDNVGQYVIIPIARYLQQKI